MKIYFISGLGCVGKTTLASQMSLELGIPSFSADNVYGLAMEKLGVSRQEVAHLATYDAWEHNEDWGIYKTPQALISQCYNELFSYLPQPQLILEGQGLFLNPSEHALVDDMFKDYDKRYLLIEQDYDNWLKYRSKRPIDEIQIKFMEEEEYYNYQKILRNLMPKGTMVLRNRKDYSCSPTGGTGYQYDEFSNPKWSAFQFPSDMKGKTFLDVSCNTGWFCKKASEAGAKVTGIDISWQVLDKAMDRVEGEFILSKIEDYVPDRKFDYVLCSSAFHYYHKREEQIEKFAQMTDNLTLELPLLDMDEFNIRYQGGEDGEFCSVVSRGLIEKWLKKYFKKVELVGESVQIQQAIQGKNRPIYRATK